VTLTGVNIVVADDQVDVARTLTQPLRTAGAKLRFVADGEQALELIRAGGNDLLIADMKMPPSDWGGLWLLQQLQRRQIGIPTLVLSGEGEQRQTIEALRYGAKDWIAKSQAAAELLSTCTRLMEVALGQAVEAMAAGGPSPLAYGYAKYRRSMGGDRQCIDGLRLIEAIVRFVTLIGLASSDAESCGKFRSVRATQMVKPSFGTWVDAISELSCNDGASLFFRSLSRHLMFRGERQLKALVDLRNDYLHGGADPSLTDQKAVFRIIEVWAHRFQSTPFTIGSHSQMRYVKYQLEVVVKEHRGALTPRTMELALSEPEFLSSPDPYLFISGQKPVRLEPWLGVFDTETGEAPSLGVFDSLKTRSSNRVSGDDVLLYTDIASGQRRKRRSDRTVRWAEVAAWFLAEGE
jgi:CheY-like chemotaxis protein